MCIYEQQPVDLTKVLLYCYLFYIFLSLLLFKFSVFYNIIFCTYARHLKFQIEPGWAHQAARHLVGESTQCMSDCVFLACYFLAFNEASVRDPASCIHLSMLFLSKM